jgi:hypothetical protein
MCDEIGQAPKPLSLWCKPRDTATIMAFLLTRNDALDANPAVGVDEVLSVHGSDWLWAVTAVYVVAFVSPSPSPMAFPHGSS